MQFKNYIFAENIALHLLCTINNVKQY